MKAMNYVMFTNFIKNLLTSKSENDYDQFNTCITQNHMATKVTQYNVVSTLSQR